MEDKPQASLGRFARQSRTVSRHRRDTDATGPDRLWASSPHQTDARRHRQASPLTVYIRRPASLPCFSQNSRVYPQIYQHQQPPPPRSPPARRPRCCPRRARSAAAAAAPPPRGGTPSVRSHLEELKRRQSSIDEMKRQAWGGDPQVSRGEWGGPTLPHSPPRGGGRRSPPPSRGGCRMGGRSHSGR
ncbi:serine/arginine repetitive matrix protein 1-like [Harpia harpyja]|uniref:serine/arginine repetitive matrix protein 1-like n=1 Tax=Harpia harpyja TaxID=202280 RepID=UPI0022B129ED|nr:serine/arginine repetitive matrix protein 1-like [Harpia harpyja]